MNRYQRKIINLADMSCCNNQYWEKGIYDKNFPKFKRYWQKYLSENKLKDVDFVDILKHHKHDPSVGVIGW